MSSALKMFLNILFLVLSRLSIALSSPPLCTSIYSFRNSTYPQCYLLKFDCRNNPPDTTISDIENILLAYNKSFDDQHLRPQNPHIFFITFFKCRNPHHDRSYNPQPCQHHNHNITLSVPDPKLTPTNCQILQLPFPRITLQSKHLFSPLSAPSWITIKLCHQRKCHHGQEGAKPKKIIIGVTVGVGFMLIVLLAAAAIFMIRRARNRKATAYSRDIDDNSLCFGVPLFSYAELQDATHHFDSSQELGDGGFGTVYYGKLRDGREVAVKRLYEHNYKRVQQFINEVEILTRLRHKNLVSLYGCTSRRSVELLLVYEYIANGTVADHLHGDQAKESPLTWPIRMKIAMETASALVYLHASDIIHRDVKTNNILLDQNYCVKVADFGLSRLLPNDVTHVSTAPQGTPGYVDPEYHQCYQLTDKSDVYSFGVVLIELISSMPAIDISRSRDEISLAYMAINRIQRCALDELIDPGLGSDSETERMTRSVAELAFRCLQFDSETRPTMNEVLEFLKGIQGEGTTEGGNELDTGKQQMASASPETEVAGLFKGVVMPSPISVTAKWHSTGSGVTTPNTSG